MDGTGNYYLNWSLPRSGRQRPHFLSYVKYNPNTNTNNVIFIFVLILIYIYIISKSETGRRNQGRGKEGKKNSE
jgi:hypothetical protein